MKTLLYSMLTVLGMSTAVHSAEIPFTFSTVDVAVPEPDQVAQMVDLNDFGDILVNSDFGGWGTAVAGQQASFCQQPQPEHLYTAGESLNNMGSIVGGCATPPTGDDPDSPLISGFLKQGNQLTMLNAPGAVGTWANGVSSNSQYVTGQWWGPHNPAIPSAMFYRFHCFIYNTGTGEYSNIDFPGAYVNCVAVNDSRRVLGEYIAVTPEGEYLEHGYFVWDNGNVTVPLPLSTDHVGGPAFYGWDMNNNDAILVWGVSAPDEDGVTTSQLGFWDDGVLYDVNLPAGQTLSELGGMNNNGQFVGRYWINVGGTFESHGFVATPTPPAPVVAKRAKPRPKKVARR